MLKVFIGFDPRQPLAYNVLQHSIVSNSTVPVSITPLILKQLPIKRRGLTEFTFSRFLVPWLCNYEGTALFLDADMVVTGNILELFAQADDSDVMVMKQQARFEWASAMLFNCERCKVLTPEYIDDTSHNPLELKWATKIGEFSSDWNHCVGYAQPTEAKLYHYTKGIPVWPQTQVHVEDPIWFEAFERANFTVDYADLMANSVHDKTLPKAC